MRLSGCPVTVVRFYAHRQATSAQLLFGTYFRTDRTTAFIVEREADEFEHPGLRAGLDAGEYTIEATTYHPVTGRDLT